MNTTEAKELSIESSILEAIKHHDIETLKQNIKNITIIDEAYIKEAVVLGSRSPRVRALIENMLLEQYICDVEIYYTNMERDSFIRSYVQILYNAIFLKDIGKVRAIIQIFEKYDINKNYIYNIYRSQDVSNRIFGYGCGSWFEYGFGYGGWLGYDYNFTPLSYAVIIGNINIIEMLIKAGFDVNFDKWNEVSTPATFSALHNAIVIQEPNIEIVRMLLENWADPKINTNLLAYGIPKNPVIANLLANVMPKNREIAKMLIEAGADVNTSNDKCNPLLYAIETNDIEIAKMLIEHGADVNKQDDHIPLISAIQARNPEIVAMLIEAGADVNKQDEHIPLISAIQARNTEIVKMIIEHGANVNKQGEHIPLISAIQIPSTRIVAMLIEAGANVNKQNEHIPLISAIEKQNANIVKMLIAAGANVTKYLLTRAIEIQNTKIVKILLDHERIDVNAYLKIETKIDENTITTKNMTPLAYAISCSSMEVIGLLIQSGARPINFESIDIADGLSIKEIENEMTEAIFQKFEKIKENCCVIYDTNFLLDYCYGINFIFEKTNHIKHCIPKEVIKELDKLKVGGNDRNAYARVVAKTLDKMLHKNVFEKIDMDNKSSNKNCDERIIQTIKDFANKTKFQKIYICSFDNILRVEISTLGIDNVEVLK